MLFAIWWAIVFGVVGFIDLAILGYVLVGFFATGLMVVLLGWAITLIVSD